MRYLSLFSRLFFIIFIFYFVYGLEVLGQDAAQTIRRPVYAGQFYDGHPERLSSRVAGFLAAVEGLPSLPQDPMVIIVPHAGYIYSGQTAAYAYALVKGKAYDKVVIIGPSHQFGFSGCSIWPRGGFETPLGVMPVDEETSARLMKATGFEFIPEAHAQEHSVEVQIPFLQKVLPRAKIVPVVMGFPTRRVIERLADGLAQVLEGEKALVVVSTDMSHYLPQDEANKIDGETAQLVAELKIETLLRKVISGENIMCGGGGVCAGLLYLQKLGEPRVAILRYADSTEGGGPKSQVVGYLAAAAYLTSEARRERDKEANLARGKSSASPESTFFLPPEEKKELLLLAKRAVELYVREGKVLSYHPDNPRFWEEKGAFVTIKKRGQLRGCIGYIEPVLPLYLTIIRCAILAATEDPRFNPVEVRELNSLNYEISVLTTPQRVNHPREIVVGRHGLIISREGKRGVLLPQVPVEEGWDRETFLAQVCLKAGLPPDAWRLPGTELYVFEAIVFH